MKTYYGMVSAATHALISLNYRQEGRWKNCETFCQRWRISETGGAKQIVIAGAECVFVLKADVICLRRTFPMCAFRFHLPIIKWRGCSLPRAIL